MRLSRAAAASATLAIAIASGSAQATLITFDEIPWVPSDSFPPPDPVVSQYAAFGVTFDTGYLAQSYTSVTPPPAHINQYLLGGYDMRVTFSGTLPLFVNFNMSSPYGASSESYVAAVNAQGQVVGTGRTGGFYPDGSQDPPWQQDLPYRANRYITLSSDTGIAALQFYDAYGSRLSTSIDNLYFAAIPAVPEPATLALWGAGLAVLALGRRRMARA